MIILFFGVCAGGVATATTTTMRALGNRGGTPRAKVFVPFSHAVVGQTRFLLQHRIHCFMEIINVFGKRVARTHMRHRQRQFLKIAFQVFTTVLARQNVLQRQNVIAVLVFL